MGTSKKINSTLVLLFMMQILFSQSPFKDPDLPFETKMPEINSWISIIQDQTLSDEAKDKAYWGLARYFCFTKEHEGLLIGGWNSETIFELLFNERQSYPERFRRFIYTGIACFSKDEYLAIKNHLRSSLDVNDKDFLSLVSRYQLTEYKNYVYESIDTIWLQNLEQVFDDPYSISGSRLVKKIRPVITAINLGDEKLKQRMLNFAESTIKKISVFEDPNSARGHSLFYYEIVPKLFSYVYDLEFMQQSVILFYTHAENYNRYKTQFSDYNIPKVEPLYLRSIMNGKLQLISMAYYGQNNLMLFDFSASGMRRLKNIKEAIIENDLTKLGTDYDEFEMVRYHLNYLPPEKFKWSNIFELWEQDRLTNQED